MILVNFEDKEVILKGENSYNTLMSTLKDIERAGYNPENFKLRVDGWSYYVPTWMPQITAPTTTPYVDPPYWTVTCSEGNYNLHFEAGP